MLCLVALTDGTALDELTDEAGGVGVEEGRPKPMKSLLDALVSRAVRRGQNLGPERGRGRHEDTAVVEDKVINNRPSCGRCARHNVFLHLDDLRQALGLPAELIVEFERRGGETLGGQHLLVVLG